MIPRVFWKRQKRAPVLSLGLLLLVACDDGVAGPRDQSCRDFCDKMELCNDSTDVAGCVQHCIQQVVRSDEYLAARADCAQARSCNTFAREIGSMGEDLCGTGEQCALNDCTGDTIAGRTRTEQELDYCSAITSKLRACDPQVESAVLAGHCLELVPTLSRDYLAVVDSCVQGDCTEVRACLQRAADRFNTDVTPAPMHWLSRPTSDGGTALRTLDAAL